MSSFRVVSGGKEYHYFVTVKDSVTKDEIHLDIIAHSADEAKKKALDMGRTGEATSYTRYRIKSVERTGEAVG